MNSIRDIYKIGMGPSSSHTMGPRRAAALFALRLSDSNTRSVTVQLYGSLGATGRGHLTDAAVRDGLAPLPVDVEFLPDQELPCHPNAMRFCAEDHAGRAFAQWDVYSVGGGSLRDADGEVDAGGGVRYPHGSLREVMDWCESAGRSLWDYVEHHESDGLDSWLVGIWDAMAAAVQAGLACDADRLPGVLALRLRARRMRDAANESVGFQRDLTLLNGYALAVAEHNASGGRIVTAPTCGSAGVLPAVLYYSLRHEKAAPAAIRQALATAGLIGSVAVERASISGAEVGCQGEIGVACAMAAAACAQVQGGTLRQIEYAAEMGLEHWLGATCDPVAGLVQVPCIERNAFAAVRAFECAAYALATDGEHLVSLDDVLDVMAVTGRDLQAQYRETARGGLAKLMRKKLGLA